MLDDTLRGASFMRPRILLSEAPEDYTLFWANLLLNIDDDRPLVEHSKLGSLRRTSYYR